MSMLSWNQDVVATGDSVSSREWAGMVLHVTGRDGFADGGCGRVGFEGGGYGLGWV